MILPGVGEAASAMARLRERGLDEVIARLKAPCWESASACN